MCKTPQFTSKHMFKLIVRLSCTVLSEQVLVWTHLRKGNGYMVAVASLKNNKLSIHMGAFN